MNPDLSTAFFNDHARRLCSSYRHWTGKQLVPENENMNNLAQTLFEAPFALVSHGTEATPIFNFGNKIALKLFELDWDRFIHLPSRESADKANQEDRKQLMARVKQEGYATDCDGVRISATGRRFLIEGATVWNVVDDHGGYYGQAAMFSCWKFL